VLVRQYLDRMPSKLTAATGARDLLARMVVAWLGLLMSAGSVHAAGQATPAIAIRAISTMAGGPTFVVTIEATGALPLPSSGVVDGPPRIYLDFPGVALKAPAVTSSNDPRLLRVRAGVHSVKPLVTRVVLDLVTLQPYSIERGAGQVRVVVSVATNQLPRAMAPVPPLPEPPKPSPAPHEPARPLTREPVATPPPHTREPTSPMIGPPAPAPASATPVSGPPVTPAPSPPERPPARLSSPTSVPPRAASPPPIPPPPAKDMERYRRQISPALDRLRLQEPLLASLDIAEVQTVDRVQLAVEEFERLRVELAGIKPPDSLRSQHDMLIQSTTLALMATRLRLEAFRTSDPATLRNAASAAAGATLLLDRVCADLGCPDSGR
jgi:AMIN domain